MAIKGDYNPNDPFTVSDPDLAAQIAQLAGDEKSAALAKARQSQWRNKPLVECYEPGSVFKAFTSCMAIETKGGRRAYLRPLWRQPEGQGLAQAH